MVNGDLAKEGTVRPAGDLGPLQIPRPLSGFRWTVCALIFFAMTVNYMDRQVFSILVPFFEDDLKLGPTDLALINVSFILPYGCAMIFVGRFIDRVGVKRGLSTTYLLWNIASMAHAAVRSLGAFVGVRFLLGVGECGMYPSAIKTTTDWFPIKERALANGIVNAGANCGAILAPLLGVYLATRYGWRYCFVLTGLMGLVWMVFWRKMYREPENHPKVDPTELAYIRQDHEPNEPPITYSQLFGIPAIYTLSVAKALSDAPWWFYLTWMPKFLIDQFHVSAGFMAFAIPVIYIVADLGSIAGGAISSRLISRGLPVGTSRKIAMLICAVAVTPVMAVGFLVDHAPLFGVPAVFWAVGITALAAGAHQGWSSNLFTLISDTTPKNATAVAVGAINGFAMIGASAMQFFVGGYVQATSSYTLVFVVAGALYLIALAVIQITMPTVKKSDTKRRASMPLVCAGAVCVLAALGFLQYKMNQPPYKSMADYLALRGSQLHVGRAPLEGPEAHVGWMDAHWFKWGTKIELVKMDTHGQPFVESKGVKAARYKGPSLSQVEQSFGGR
jgi:ACS family hexuronate transporter-like MFS transporter